MRKHSPHHAARGVEGIVSYGVACGPLDPNASRFVGLVTQRDLAMGYDGVALVACVLDVAIAEAISSVDALLAAALRGCARQVVVASPSSLCGSDMSAGEVFQVLASLRVVVFSADRGWLNPDDFEDGNQQPTGSDHLPRLDASTALQLGDRK